VPVVAALGLPVNDLFRYGLLVIAAVVVVAGTISRRRTRWVGALAAVVLCVLAQVGLEAPRIEEGHNVFLVDDAGGVLETSLPSAAFRFMAAEFDAKYPPARRCDPAREGCWRGQAFPRQPFAFSADGIYDHSRRQLFRFLIYQAERPQSALYTACSQGIQSFDHMGKYLQFHFQRTRHGSSVLRNRRSSPSSISSTVRANSRWSRHSPSMCR